MFFSYFILKNSPRFSIGLRSGLFPGHLEGVIFSILKSLLRSLNNGMRLHLAKKLCSLAPAHAAVALSSLKLSISGHLLVIQELEKNPAVSLIEMAPHNIALGGYFIVCSAYFSLYRVPEGRRTFLFLGLHI